MDGRCILIAILIACSPMVNAQEKVRPTGERVTRPSVPGISVLVLVDYDVVRGRCTPRPDGYDVEVKSGRLFIESGRVRIVAKDMDDAYLQIRKSQVNTTPEGHMQMARWCLMNGLKEFAELEVLDALRGDPNRTDAKRLLATLRQQDGEASSVSTGLTEYSTPKRLPVDLESRSLAGLSRPISKEFTARVQPILMNKCATSGCHGVNPVSEFQLSSTARGSSPVIAERNLAAVLNQVDLTRPSSSPLLLVLEKTHGGQGSTMFRGRAGSIQMKVLRDWVQSAAADIAPDANLEVKERREALEEARRKSLLAAIRQSADREREIHGMQSPVVSSQPELAHGRMKSFEETDREFLAEADRMNANDAFSPSAFNQKYHGRMSPEGGLTDEPSEGSEIDALSKSASENGTESVDSP
ncbi:MAG: hypothetical protein ACK58L_18225 [Planctomycetota bacterium]